MSQMPWNGLVRYISRDDRIDERFAMPGQKARPRPQSLTKGIFSPKKIGAIALSVP